VMMPRSCPSVPQIGSDPTCRSRIMRFVFVDALRLRVHDLASCCHRLSSFFVLAARRRIRRCGRAPSRRPLQSRGKNPV
jgi:hypothetical protein